MKVFHVVGKVSLNKAHASLAGKRWIIAVPMGLRELAYGGIPASEELIAIDELGAAPGTLVGISEGAEAANPFLPDRKPVDAYVSCIFDRVELDLDP